MLSLHQSCRPDTARYVALTSTHSHNLDATHVDQIQHCIRIDSMRSANLDATSTRYTTTSRTDSIRRPHSTKYSKTSSIDYMGSHNLDAKHADQIQLDMSHWLHAHNLDSKHDDQVQHDISHWLHAHPQSGRQSRRPDSARHLSLTPSRSRQSDTARHLALAPCQALIRTPITTIRYSTTARTDSKPITTIRYSTTSRTGSMSSFNLDANHDNQIQHDISHWASRLWLRMESMRDVALSGPRGWRPECHCRWIQCEMSRCTWLSWLASRSWRRMVSMRDTVDVSGVQIVAEHGVTTRCRAVSGRRGWRLECDGAWSQYEIQCCISGRRDVRPECDCGWIQREMCERIENRHGTILLIVRECSLFNPRRWRHWRWCAGQKTSRLWNRKGRSGRETGERQTRRDNQHSNMWHHGWHVDGVKCALRPWATMWVWSHVQGAWEKNTCDLFLSTPRRLQWIAIDCKQNQL